MTELTEGQAEYRLQIAVLAHLDGAFKTTGLQWFHIPNRPGDAADGFFKKQMGARKGASDLVFGWPSGNAGLIELKAPGKNLKSEQNKFLSAFAAIGWKIGVCKSVREVHTVLCGWGLKPLYDNTQEPNYQTFEDKKAAAADFFAPR